MDSMALYRGMDIGTASPTLAERNEVPHHLLDLVDPTEEFTVSEFQKAASGVLNDITDRGQRAVMVGGTGLHVRAVVDDLEIPGRYDQVRADLESDDDTVGLHTRLLDLDPVAAQRMEPTNRRRVLRALEVTLGSGRPFSSFGPGLEAYPPTPFTQVGLRVDRDVLDRRIAERYERQMDEGFLDEVRALVAHPGGPSRSAAQALGYRELAVHRRGGCTLDAAVEEAVAATRRFARRQERWFRRDPRIAWVDVGDDPLAALDEVLAAGLAKHPGEVPAFMSFDEDRPVVNVTSRAPDAPAGKYSFEPIDQTSGEGAPLVAGHPRNPARRRIRR